MYSAADKRRIVAQQIIKMKEVTDNGWIETALVIKMPDGRMLRPGQANMYDLNLLVEMIEGSELIQVPVRVKVEE
ncbi:MAG: hypothetical protein ACREOB_07060 [Thermodesulfobacteriota bacterium]